MRTCVIVAMVAACDRGHREAPAPAPPSVSATVPASGCTLAPLPLRVAAKRAVAIGDLHGDIAGARAALRAAGAIDAADQWLGGDLTVVQLGDILDRGDDEAKIIDLLERLDRDARAAGGA